MKKIRSGLLALSFILSNSLAALAIKIVPSNDNLRFSAAQPSQAFTISLSDDPARLKNKTGKLKVKLKFDKKLFTSNAPKKIIIPYTKGVVGKSQAITLTLKNPDAISAAISKPYSIVLPGKLRKKLGVDKFKSELNIDHGAIAVKGRVQVPKDSVSKFRAFTNARSSGRIITPFNEETVPNTVVELHAVNDDGSVAPEIIATAVTDSQGEFELEVEPEELPVPAGEDTAPPLFGANYVVEVVADDGTEMKSFVSDDEEQIIDPIAEKVTIEAKKIIENTDGLGVEQGELELENITGPELNAVRDKLDTINPEIKPTLEDTLASLETFDGILTNVFGSIADKDAVVLVDGPEKEEPEDPLPPEEEPGEDPEDPTFPPEEEEVPADPVDPLTDDDFVIDGTETSFTKAASEVAGDYFVVFYEGVLGGTTALASFASGRLSSALSLGLARLSNPDEAGFIDLIPKPVLFAEASLNKFSNDGGQGPDDGRGIEPFEEGGQGEGPDPNAGDQGPGEDPSKKDENAPPEGSPGPGEGFGPGGPGGGDFGQGPGGPGGPDDRGPGGPQDGSNCFELDAFAGKGDVHGGGEPSLFASIDTNNVVSVVEPASEHRESFNGPNGLEEYIFRDYDEVYKFFPILPGFLIGTAFGGGEEMDANTLAVTQRDRILGFNVVIKQSAKTLQGKYGIVGTGIDLSGQGRIGISSLMGTLDINGKNVNYAFPGDEEISRELASFGSCDSGYTVTKGTIHDDGIETGVATFNTVKGRFTIDIHGEEEEGQTVMDGYGSPDGSMATVVIINHRNPRGQRIDPGGRKSKRVDSAAGEMNFLVRLPSSIPNLDGKSYRIFSYGNTLANDGGITLASHNAGTMSFSGSSVSFSGMTENYATRVGDEPAILDGTRTSDLDGTSAEVSLSATGDISFSAGAKNCKGYVHENDKSVVFYCSDSNSIGLYVGVLQ